MSALIEARSLSKDYGNSRAVDSINFEIAEGRIVGLIGPNGSGKTTTLKAILGLTNYEGHLRVLGLDPYRDRAKLMEQVCFIADVAILPRWLKVADAIEFVAGVHPRFDRAKAMNFMAKTEVRLDRKVSQLSKGMVAQLHLALVMSIDAKLLVLDEPTLGLDILFRKDFYRSLLEDYFDGERTILVTTHQVEEIEHILTDLLFIDRGRIVLDQPTEGLEERYTELMVSKEKLAEAQALKPLTQREGFGETVMVFEDVAREQLAALGKVRTPSVSDLFEAKIRGARS